MKIKIEIGDPMHAHSSSSSFVSTTPTSLYIDLLASLIVPSLDISTLSFSQLTKNHLSQKKKKITYHRKKKITYHRY
ncbi:hypothetical protein Sjap_009289 [Stephania japonica]|uniref:Uncharacterized protein n=1 Tax=Stephania japonica TaxID=461633 RepID=A0AAP0JS24_9MAGN